MDQEKMEKEGHSNGTNKTLGIYRILEVGILGVAFTIIYAFGLIRFAGAMTAYTSNPWVGKAFAAIAIIVVVAFIDTVATLIKDVKKKEDSEA